jgi:hypothetical protein
MLGKPIDWAAGYTAVFIGIRKPTLSRAKFMKRLQSHIEQASRHMRKLGLRGYIVAAHGDYEVAYMNWHSKEAHDQASSAEGTEAITADAQSIMNPLMYEKATKVKAGVDVDFGKAYSTVRRVLR